MVFSFGGPEGITRTEGSTLIFLVITTPSIWWLYYKVVVELLLRETGSALVEDLDDLGACTLIVFRVSLFSPASPFIFERWLRGSVWEPASTYLFYTR